MAWNIYFRSISGPTNEALSLIDFETMADYQQYRNTLANDPAHKTNVASLEQRGVVLAMARSIIQRIGHS